jgi:predicted Zn finger-like uncharacterized protein
MTQIVCPSCDATYQVPDAALAAGRRLRCAKCGHLWRAPGPAMAPDVGADPPAIPIDEAEPHAEAQAESAGESAADPEPARDIPPAAEADPLHIAAPPRPAPGGMALRLAWVASLGAMLGGIGALYAWRGEVATAWPPFGHVVGWLGG